MADPKGPETAQGAKDAPSARPKPRTLDLSATDLTPKAAPASSAAPSSPAASGPSASAAKTEPPSSRSTATAAASSSASGSKIDEPSAAPAAKPGAPAAVGPGKAGFADQTTAPKSAGPGASAAAPSAAAQPKGPAPSPEERPKPGEPASSASKAPPAPPPAPRSGVGAVGLLAAALGGAALAVLVIALFGREIIRSDDAARVAAAESKIDGVGRDVAALRKQIGQTAQSSDANAIEQRVAELGQTIEAANGRVGGLEQQFKDLTEKAAQPSVDPAAVALLAGRLDGVDIRLKDAATTEALGALGERLAAAESQAKAAPTAQQIAAIDARVAGVGQTVTDAVKPFDDRISALEAALKARPVGDPDAREVVALGALEQAVDAGRPFAAELAAVKASSQNGQLSGLDPYAAAGVPTRTALAAELSRILGELPSPKLAQDESVFGRFVASAGSIVKVSPKNASDAGAGDPRQRLAALAAAGDLEQAIAAREALDSAAQDATADWAKAATARVVAEKTLAGARSAALARLAATD